MLYRPFPPVIQYIYSASKMDPGRYSCNPLFLNVCYTPGLQHVEVSGSYSCICIQHTFLAKEAPSTQSRAVVYPHLQNGFHQPMTSHFGITTQEKNKKTLHLLSG